MLKVRDLGINGIPEAERPPKIGWFAQDPTDPTYPSDPTDPVDEELDTPPEPPSSCTSGPNTTIPRRPDIRPAKGPGPGCAAANTHAPGPPRKASASSLGADAVAQIRQQLSELAN